MKEQVNIAECNTCNTEFEPSGKLDICDSLCPECVENYDGPDDDYWSGLY